LDIADLDGDIDMDVERDRASVSVVGGDLDIWSATEGVVLEALAGADPAGGADRDRRRSRLMLDVAGYRAGAGRCSVISVARRPTGEDLGETARLDPMTPFERKIVHDAVRPPGCAASPRVRSRSDASSSCQHEHLRDPGYERCFHVKHRRRPGASRGRHSRLMRG
jgi:spoIIIJ-associated protein